VIHSLKKGEIPQLGFAEFISLTAMMMSLVALSVDTMLPALAEIGRDLDAVDNNRSQLIGKIAGIGAGVVGSLSTFIFLIAGTVIGQSYNGTVLPLTAGFFMLSLASLAAMRWAEK
jgi:hypothetical protein